MTEPRPRFLAALATALGLIVSGFTAHLAPQGTGWWFGLTGGPTPARIGLVLLAGTSVWLFGRTRDVRPFLLMSAGLLPLIPALFGLGSAFLFFSDYSTLLLFTVLCGWTFQDLDTALPSLGQRSVFLIAFAFFLLVGRFVPGAAGPQGDEPHYLLIAESLIHDGDVDLKNQFDERAFSKFTSANLEPHTAPRSPKGTLYAIHTPGLAALIAPGYAIGGFAGARAVLSALMALVVSLLFVTARSLFGAPVATFVFVLATFSSPLPIYANSVFPDSAATLPVAATLAYLAVTSPTLIFLACVSIATLPWLHPRFLPLALLLAVAVSFKGGFSVRRAAMVFVPLFASLGALLLHFQKLFGSASLSAAYGPAFSSDVSLLRIPWGASALLFDRQFGLLLFAPIFLLGFAGARALWKRDRLLAALALASAFGLLDIGGAFSMWWGGASAPARFLIGATPAFLILCSALWQGIEKHPGHRALMGAAMGFGAGVVWLACLAPRALHNRSDGESGLLRLLAPVLDLDRFFPSFVTDTGTWLALAWTAVIVVSLIRPRIGVWFAALPIACVWLTSPTPLLDPFSSSLRAMESWDDHRRTFGGADRSDGFQLDVPLGASSWDLSAGSQAHSPRFSLPAGTWTARVESRAEGTPDALNLARVVLSTDDEAETALGSVLIQAGGSAATTTFTLAKDERRLRFRGEGLQSRATILSIRLLPANREP